MKRIAGLLICLWMGTCCLFTQPVAEYPPIEQLVIDESSFPAGWEASQPNTDFPPLAPWTTGRREVECVSRSFRDPAGSGAGGMTIQRFRNTRDAAQEYEHQVDVAFRVRDSWSTPWTTPPELLFESHVADQYRYACATVGYYPQVNCAYVARYRVYVVDFIIKLYDTNVITYTDLLPILRAIDNRMTLAIGREQ